ncbi:DsbA family oxidoreductase [Paracoccus saliphilus]|uniref:DsbA family oxidoreductase n=1 Tax=Paracoccus saliphilus TaxID=405559 RepID=A0AA46A620_9RHOB|nr:DsbA family oxidoreductase [Paracoccus saliphilus]WCR02180.1 DsbA family oxidoreductase [Paracoccus saliphilus]SIS90943.1 Predicted dithiol-disulfide isomerase, DsbA family [Paracoccus saliphilus]
MIRLDIFSDPVCPWCLIGKLELDRALESRPDHPFEIIWHPFRLNPQMPAEGMDRLEYLKAKPGAADAARAVAERAAGMGLELQLPERQPNTTDAHRLMHWAGLEGAQSRVMSGLLRAYWQEARDIGDKAELARIAKAAGMDEAVTARLLAGDADREEVIGREMHARERGINAVPTFIVADTHAVSGAQPSELWQNVIDDLTTSDGKTPLQ